MNMTAMAGTMRTSGANTLPKPRRFHRIQRATLFLACIACVVGTVALGFTWGGWVTSAKATGMAASAASTGQAKLAATICADRFITAPNAQAEIALLRWTEAGRRGDFIKQGGWLILPGISAPISGAAELCVQNILSTSSAGN